MARIGLFGGSFDPIHFGHLLLAETCREHLQLDRVWLIPAATSPLKPQGTFATAEDRVAMCRAAIAGTPTIEINTVELQRQGISYTIDTVRHLQSQPDGDRHEFVLLIGADAVNQFGSWHQPSELLRRIRLGIVTRAGHPAPDLEILQRLLGDTTSPYFPPWQVPMPRIEISSTDLRRRAGQGKSLRFRTPRVVEDYILDGGLYR
jgi:nicotinate-nucleotide adenylyltransferase